MKKKIFAALPICAVALSAAFAAVSAGTAGFASDVYAYENLEANYSLEIVAAAAIVIAAIARKGGRKDA